MDEVTTRHQPHEEHLLGRITPANSTAHVYSSIRVAADGSYLEALEWNAWIDTLQHDAEQLATAGYRVMLERADQADQHMAVARYTVAVPEGLFIDLANEYSKEGVRINRGQHLSDFFYDVQWETDWRDPSVTVVEENPMSAIRRAYNAERFPTLAHDTKGF